MENKQPNKENDSLMQDILNENDALKQSVIIGRIIQDSIDKTAERSHRIIKWLAWLLALSIAVNVVIVGAFLWYESQWEYETTTTTTQTVEGDSAEINNVEGNQYKDSARHYEGTEKTEPQGGTS